MNRREAALARRVVEGLRGAGADVQKHEDRYSSGIADLSVAHAGRDAWVELKRLPDWPARESTPVRVGLRKEQALWLHRRGRSGSGLVWVLAQVATTHLLLPWEVAGTVRGGVPREHLEGLAAAAWGRTLPYADLLDAITDRNPSVFSG